MNRNPFADVPQIEPKSAHDEWASGEADMVDVREEDEWNLGHIEGIKWIPLGELPRRWRELDPAKKLVCVCRSGNRSNYAAAMLRQAGIDASNMSGGMLQWKQEKLPVTPPGIIESH
jgi:rhodanese-related sulfurtransferase